MQLITIGTKNQIVLPKEVRIKIKGLKPGNRVMVYPLNESTVAIKADTKNWIEKSRGLTAAAWKDIDTTAYLDKLTEKEFEKITGINFEDFGDCIKYGLRELSSSKKKKPKCFDEISKSEIYKEIEKH
jgi:AbrB family looped-hinge helix DNA binding protein